MRTKILLAAILAGLGGLTAARAARADDTALLNRFTPPPNVLIILDTSQSMTWYNSFGASRGDEYPGWAADNTPQARMAMAKDVLSTVVDRNFSLLRLGLASYAEGGTPANPNANVRIRRLHYYCGYNGTWCTSPSVPNPPRQYISFFPPGTSVTVPSPGLATDYNNLQLWVDGSNLNMPSQNTFTLQWDLDAGRVPNPQVNYSVGSSGSPGRTDTYCVWEVTETWWSSPNVLAPGYPRTYNVTNVQPANATCFVVDPSTPSTFVSGTLTRTLVFNQRAAGDDPNPYKYDLNQAWTASNGPTTWEWAPACPTPQVGNPSCTSAWQTYLTPSWKRAEWVYTYKGGTQTVVIPPSGGSPERWSWTYYYKGACTDGCSGFLTDYRTTGTVTGATPSGAPTPSPLPSPLATPFPRVYTWSGNRYETRVIPQSNENSCGVGLGISMLVDVGGAPDTNTIKNYLGTGLDKRKELHGANFYTPLSAGLDTTLAYFTKQPPFDTMNPHPVQDDLQKDCRKNYVVLITDGGESCPLILTPPVQAPTVPGTRAAALLNAAINALGGAQTFVVGLDAGNFFPDEQTVLADIAAQGSPGGTATYYSASNSTALLNTLQSIIGNILSQQYTFVPPVLPSLRAQDNLMLVQGSFKTPLDPSNNPPPFPPPGANAPLWQGVLEAFPLSSTGTVQITGQQITATPLWEAGALLAGRAGRTITTVVGGSQTPFTKTNPVRTALAVTADLNGDTVINSADADLVIDTVLGPAPGGNGFLGDIFHSVPAIVGGPSATFVDRTFDPANPAQLLSLGAAPDTFAPFRSVWNTRQRLAIVGTNAGMLHAFNAGTFDTTSNPPMYNTGTGAELWGFVPPQMLPKLQYLAMNNGHQYYVDASPKVADAWLDLNNDGIKAANGSEWRTVLISGFRQGGTGLFALDITDTTTPVFMWTYATTGESWSEPAIGKVKVQVAGRLVDRWVAIVGDGYDSTGTNGRMVHIIDIQTGKALWRYATSSPVAASPLALDMDNDGYVDRVYVGTLGGDVLRVDISAVGRNSGGDVNPASGVLVDNWSVGVFFSAGAAQPIFVKGAATMDPAGNLWFFIGSGDRNNPLLIPGTANRIYGIKDPYVGTPIAAITEADLTNMTLNNTLDTTAVTGQGWYVVLRPGEKEWAETALVFNSQVFFTTFTPGTTSCGDVGSGTIYMVYYLTGGGVTDTALFEASPPVASSRVYQVNAGATTRPVVTTGTLGANAVVYLSNSNMLTLTPSFSAPSSIRATRYWIRVR